MVDLTGVAVVEVRDAAAVAAITPRVRGGELAGDDAPPAVAISALGIGYSPFGQTRRARLQEAMFAAKCYGGTRIQAAQLGNAVAGAIEVRGPRKDASGRLVYLSLVESAGTVELDPDTRWPFSTVIFSLIGAQQAVP